VPPKSPGDACVSILNHHYHHHDTPTPPPDTRTTPLPSYQYHHHAPPPFPPLHPMMPPQSPGDVTLRACAFSTDTGLGAFATLPLAKDVSGRRAAVGVRYSSPLFTSGAVLQPATNTLSHVWLCGRHHGLTRKSHFVCKRPSAVFPRGFRVLISQQVGKVLCLLHILLGKASTVRSPSPKPSSHPCCHIYTHVSWCSGAAKSGHARLQWQLAAGGGSSAWQQRQQC